MNKIFAWAGLLAFCFNGCVSKPVSVEAPTAAPAPSAAAPERVKVPGAYVCFSTDAKFPISVADSTAVVLALKELDASMAPVLKQLEGASPDVRDDIQKLYRAEVTALT